ncbi:transmembrane protein 69-like [Limulus polyphemus]|uniref:Transmembrane protein 69-like n=1 Tax=Limulus polyphemus TaxID=6850 RepID=A0ABM1SCS5_LIMPO|nr:transmembrane protein 69-like [Limulus polyphemus]XP_022241430.1 transmembrane protein 69-like [Limulus polyphemus]
MAFHSFRKLTHLQTRLSLYLCARKLSNATLPLTFLCQHYYPKSNIKTRMPSFVLDCSNKTACKAGQNSFLLSAQLVCTSSVQNLKEDHKTKALQIISDLRHLKASPAAALTYGFLGLIPFLVPPFYIMSSEVYIPSLAFAQLAYGAVILSFLGGVRWGITLPEESIVKPDWQCLGYSVLPSLIAWVGLLLPDYLNTLTVIGGLGLAAYLDTTMYGYPPWFKALRFTLSFIALLALWTTLTCSLMYEHKGKAKKVQVLENID